jgi:hypothetical protein
MRPGLTPTGESHLLYRMRGFPMLCWSVFLIIAGCDATADRAETEPGDCSNGGGGEAGRTAHAAVPSGIECSFNFRQSNELGEGDDPSDPEFQFQEELVNASSNEDAEATLGQLTLHLSYSVDEIEGTYAQVSVTTEDAALFRALYQVGDQGVANQFEGDHGFTGLIYLTHPTDGGDYQLICKAL